MRVCVCVCARVLPLSSKQKFSHVEQWPNSRRATSTVTGCRVSERERESNRQKEIEREERVAIRRAMLNLGLTVDVPHQLRQVVK